MKKVIIASVCSNLDLFLLGLLRNPGVMPGFGCEINKQMCLIHQANYKYPNGEPLLQFIEVTDEYYNSHYVAPADAAEKVKKQFAAKRKLEVLVADGKRYRSRGIQEITGYEIRAAIEKHYGKDVIIILVGGPPCQDSSRLSRTNKGRNGLILEFPRILKEGDFDAALMEEIPQIRTSEPEVWAAYEKYASSIPYQWGRKDVDAINYEGNSSRLRMICQFINKKYNRLPVFPIPMPELAKRAGEVIKCERWHSGHFDDRIRTKDDYFTTVTRSSPRTIWEIDEVNTALSGKQVLLERSGTVADKQKLMGQKEGELVIPKSIPESELHLAYGNGVPVGLAFHLGKNLLEKVLCIQHVGDGWFAPIDNVIAGNNNPTGVDNPVPVTPSPEEVSFTNDSEVPPVDSVFAPTQSEESPGAIESLTVPILQQVPNKPVATPIAVITRDTPVVNTTHQKIYTCSELLSMQFDQLDFQDKWEAFFGKPTRNFHCIIHGLPGEGKSTFAICFARYLVHGFGKVLYISAEEGLSGTFINKVANANINSDNFHIIHLKSYPELLKAVPVNTYDFIFIDSLDTMHIHAVAVKLFRARHKNTAFITISQSTKGGLIRGSQELIHDSDIAVQVSDGVAETTKNRFKPKGATFPVFDTAYHQEEGQDKKVHAENP